MNIARLNLSHGTQAETAVIIETIRSLNEKNGTTTATLIDTKGAEIRTGVVAHPIPIAKDQEVVFSPHPLSDEERTVISVNYDQFYRDVGETDRILIDSGELTFDILSVEQDGSVVARSRDEGSVGDRRHITLPGADIDLPSITEKDWEDIAFAVEQKVDFVALSFVRSADDVREVREFMKKHSVDIDIVSKIESQKAVDNLAEIIEVSDAIMIARGDLGSDLAFEDLPALQDEIVVRCRDQGVPVIVATHMLESIIEHPVPTRAEVTDVAHAAMTGADATMLSGETAIGQYPFKAIEAMARILEATEQRLSRFPLSPNTPIRNERIANAEAAVTLADSSVADALMVFTRTGQTAREVSMFRPHQPIIAVTPSDRIQRKLQLVYGVQVIVIPFADPEKTVVDALNAARKSGILTKGQNVVLLSDLQATDTVVQSVQVREA